MGFFVDKRPKSAIPWCKSVPAATIGLSKRVPLNKSIRNMWIIVAKFDRIIWLLHGHFPLQRLCFFSDREITHPQQKKTSSLGKDIETWGKSHSKSSVLLGPVACSPLFLRVKIRVFKLSLGFWWFFVEGFFVRNNLKQPPQNKKIRFHPNLSSTSMFRTPKPRTKRRKPRYTLQACALARRGISR